VCDSMDARQQDAWDWDWEVLLPDHTSSSSVSHRGSKNNLDGKDRPSPAPVSRGVSVTTVRVLSPN
jgi:hypothetical protein